MRKAVGLMKDEEADEVVLETEQTNSGALTLYENLGFVRDKRLSRYYLNGVDAFRYVDEKDFQVSLFPLSKPKSGNRLKLWLK